MRWLLVLGALVSFEFDCAHTNSARVCRSINAFR